MKSGKRAFDLLIACGLLILFSPVLAIVALLIRWFLGSPVLFRQTRPGLHGKPFDMVKFRSMLDAVGPEGKPLPDELRLTRFGKTLRALSLDELPELVNVIKGEMSIVGPRPLLPSYLPRYSPEQARRHEVPPGITGWAQINGRNAISWPDKFKLDVWYVDHWSLWLDLKILVLTAFKVFKREGVSAPGKLTAPEFMGNEDRPG